MDVTDDLVAIVFFRCEQGRHEFSRVMGFQVRRLVGDHR